MANISAILELDYESKINMLASLAEQFEIWDPDAAKQEFFNKAKDAFGPRVAEELIQIYEADFEESGDDWEVVSARMILEILKAMNETP